MEIIMGSHSIKKRIGPYLLTLLLSCASQTVQAVNLLQVFQDAVDNDPTFKQAEAQMLSTRENIPLAVAQYLPQVFGTMNYAHNHLDETVNAFPTNRTGSYNALTYALNLDQPVFNATFWEQIQVARENGKAAVANYFAAAQDLITRTIQAYLNVLQAYDNLRYTLANKRALRRQLVASEEKFKVGLVAITEVYDSQAQYDQSIATEIAYRTVLDNSLEQLQAITKHYYTELAGLGENSLPMIPPEPVNLDAWVHIAEKQNYAYLAQFHATKAAYETIVQNITGHLPTLDIQGQYSTVKTFNQPGVIQNSIIGQATTGDLSDQTTTIGLNLQVPIFAGGAVVEKTEQARYNYASACANLQFIYRQIVSQTRQAYLGVVTGISKIQADIQSVKSASNDVEATEEGYKVGTRIILDLLNNLTRLYQTQQQYATDQYAYINNFVLLKEQAGTLNYQDLIKINSWLKKKIQFTGEYSPTRVRLQKPGYSFDYRDNLDIKAAQAEAKSHQENTNLLSTPDISAKMPSELDLSKKALPPLDQPQPINPNAAIPIPTPSTTTIGIQPSNLPTITPVTAPPSPTPPSSTTTTTGASPTTSNNQTSQATGTSSTGNNNTTTSAPTNSSPTTSNNTAD